MTFAAKTVEKTSNSKAPKRDESNTQKRQVDRKKMAITRMPQKICDTAVYPWKEKVNTECPLEALPADTQNASSPLAAIRVPPRSLEDRSGAKGYADRAFLPFQARWNLLDYKHKNPHEYLAQAIHYPQSDAFYLNCLGGKLTPVKFAHELHKP